MDSNKVTIAFKKVKEDMGFLRDEIDSIQKSLDKKPKAKTIESSVLSGSVKDLEKAISNAEKSCDKGLLEVKKLVIRLDEKFEEKLSTEISVLRSEFEEKLADIEQKNSYVDGEDLY